jgi:hypothetical protein
MKFIKTSNKIKFHPEIQNGIIGYYKKAITMLLRF